MLPHLCPICQNKLSYFLVANLNDFPLWYSSSHNPLSVHHFYSNSHLILSLQQLPPNSYLFCLCNPKSIIPNSSNFLIAMADVCYYHSFSPPSWSSSHECFHLKKLNCFIQQNYPSQISRVWFSDEKNVQLSLPLLPKSCLPPNLNFLDNLKKLLCFY